MEFFGNGNVCTVLKIKAFKIFHDKNLVFKIFNTALIQVLHRYLSPTPAFSWRLLSE